ncbi:MAG: carbohydrate kinase family protein [Candidatus Methanomethylophilaceae archaeon]|jgi:sugar/nucleoside kinase (ribokinase family)
MSEGSAPFLSVYGHITMDQILSVKRFPQINETVDVVEKNTVLGGTGTNIAVTAAKLGVPTAICAFVGQDFSPNYEGFMRGSGLIMDDFVKVSQYETSQCVILNNAEMEQKVVFYQGPQGCASKLGMDLLGCASKSKYVHFCTGEPAYYISLMKKLSGKGIHMAVDPAQEVYKMWSKESLSGAFDQCDALFCNDYEAKVIEKYLGIGDVLSINLPVVVRTLGENGSIAKVDGKLYEIPTIKAGKVADPTGAGDAYRAGYYAGLYRGYNPVDSLTIASAVSSFVVEKVGALTNTPTWDQVMERADKYL